MSLFKFVEICPKMAVMLIFISNRQKIYEHLYSEWDRAYFSFTCTLPEQYLFSKNSLLHINYLKVYNNKFIFIEIDRYHYQYNHCCQFEESYHP